MSNATKEKIFLIHGLFMHGVVMQFMQRQLQRRGYEVVVFSYRSVYRPLADNADALVDFVKQHSDDSESKHFVGHSLGGLLIRLAYERAPQLFNGRIVTIGTPHNGSEVAERVAKSLHNAVLGGAFKEALDGDLPPWQGEVQLGSIAGSKSIGIAMAMPDLPCPNDGTVTVAETRLAGQTDHASVTLSHTAMLYSKRVVNLTDAFLQHGHF